MPTVYYKVLGEDRMPCHGGSDQWPEPGTWHEVTGELIPCKNGLHLCRREDLVHWLGRTIWEAEAEGEVIEHDDKVVVRKARLVRQLETWNERTARLFAADCAEHVLHLYEQQYLGDSRPRQAIAAARDFANGAATPNAVAAAWDAAQSAAGAAAWDAAGAAAQSAAWDEEYAWQTERLFQYLNGDIR